MNVIILEAGNVEIECGVKNAKYYNLGKVEEAFHF